VLRQGEQYIMQFMQMLKASLKPRRSLLATLVMVGVVASVMGLAPTHGASNTLAQDCANPPSTPTFNYWPVTYDDDNTPFCHDFQAIDAALDVANPQWSQSASDWNDGLTLQVGQQAAAGIYIHNGAANNLDPALTMARDVHIITETSTTPGSSHQIKVTFTASNAASYSKSFTVHTPANSTLEVIPNSGFMYDYQGRVILDQQNLNLGNSDFTLGELDACFEYSLFLTYKFKVKGPAQPTGTTLSIDKGVRNETRDGVTTRTSTYAPSVNADKNDKVAYKVTVTNTGSTVARGATMSDNSVNGIQVDAGSTTVGTSEDALLANNLWQGAIPGTINLGDLQPGETRIIKYTGRVTVCDTLVNTARAQASNAPEVSDKASVVVRCENPTNPNIKIKKWVKNDSTNSSYSDTLVDARTGERVKFKVTVSNTGNATLNNVRMSDRIPDGLQFDDSVTGDGTASYNIPTFSVNFGSIVAGESKTVEFAAKVLATGNTTVCNVAKATGTSVNEVQDDACVKIYTTPKPGSPNIVLSKRAFNDTKNVDATSVNAARGDYITYSLITTNNGTADQTNYVIRDDLSQVLPLADLVAANGGTVTGNVISYPAVTIKPGETVVKTFKVRIKQTLDKNLSYQLKNTYGNTVIITVPGEKVYQAPTTGAAGTSAAAFAGLVTAGFVLVRNRGSLLKFLLA
jgi:uncharacterized repeat protein (TIGR01451 family)